MSRQMGCGGLQAEVPSLSNLHVMFKKHDLPSLESRGSYSSSGIFTTTWRILCQSKEFLMEDIAQQFGSWRKLIEKIGLHVQCVICVANGTKPLNIYF